MFWAAETGLRRSLWRTFAPLLLAKTLCRTAPNIEFSFSFDETHQSPGQAFRKPSVLGSLLRLGCTMLRTIARAGPLGAEVAATKEDEIWSVACTGPVVGEIVL